MSESVFRLAVPLRERDLTAVEREDAVIGEGDAVGKIQRGLTPLSVFDPEKHLSTKLHTIFLKEFNDPPIKVRNALGFY